MGVVGGPTSVSGCSCEVFVFEGQAWVQCWAMIGRFRLNRLMGRVFHACSQVVTWISAVAPTTRAIATSTVATASCSPSVPVETVRERVAQEYDVAEPAHLRQLRTAVWVPREASVADEPLRPGVAHEERRDDQLQLVRKAGR